MANFKIMRNGLNTEIVGDPHIGQSSEDVTVTVTDDGTYQEYDKKLYYSYGYRNQIYRAIAEENSSGEFVIPMTAFLEPGLIKLSVELSNGTNKPTCNACFIIATNGAKSVAASDILPDEETWQSYIQSYLKSDIVHKPTVDALEKRIDNLILSSGSESSAEVIDARTGYDGTAYNTLGTAIRTQVNNLKSNIDNKSGITTNHANTLWAILQKTKFYEQVTSEELNAFKNAWGIKSSSSGGDSGGSEEGGDDTPTVTYIVTRNLVGCTSNSNVTKIREGSTLNETLSANKGYTLPTTVQGGSIIITMSGTEITSNVYDYNTGAINISSVTGNIVINVECAKEAVLPTNGLDDYFDLRNAKLVDLGSYKSYKATSGNGVIFGNANENIKTDDKGMLYARYDYSTQGDVRWNDYPMPFTFASLTHSAGYTGSSAYMPSNMWKFANNQWNLCPTYNNSSGSTTQLGNTPQGSLTDGYHTFFITAKDKVLKFYLDGNLIQTYSGNDYSDFVSWKSFQRLACMQLLTDHATAFATWNRVLNEDELNEVERYFRTLEVK